MAIGQRLRDFVSKPFVFFSVLMILKIYLAKFAVFNEAETWLALATGIPSVWLVFSLIELLLPKKKLGAYLVANLVMTSIYFAVIMYYKYFGVIVTYTALSQVNQVTEVKGSVFSLLHPYFLLIYVDVVILFFILIFSKRARAWGRSLRIRERTPLFSGLAVLSLAACVFSVMPNKGSMNEILQAQNMGILNYEVYVAFASSKDAPVDVSNITQAEIDKLKGEPAQTETPAYWGSAQGKNVIIIQMEAFQNFLLGLNIDGTEITPNLNKLMKGSLYFPRFFQQVGQGNTADAEFVVNTSFYVPRDGAASQEYADKELPSAPRTFAANGYDTATFHTNSVEFWNRKAMYPALGWDKYYDKEFFGDEDTVMFAASDEVLYAKTADKLAEMQSSGKPFYTQIISMSGHHPFNIPGRKYKMDLPDRYEGTLVGDYIRAQNYSDWALGQFIDKLKANGVWDNSLVVIYGDHQGLPIYSLTSAEKKLMKDDIYHRDYTVQDMMNIPLILKLPGDQQEAQVINQVGGQSDIFPTIANLAGISLADHIHFGEDLLNTTHNVLPQRYYLPTGSFINDTSVFVPGKSFKDGTATPIGGGEGKGEATQEEYDEALQLLSMSDAYVRSLPDRKE
ncbi:LTA synthase family protein [Cohnella lubricantis]|uniref:LTA synthase family protein n=1 Tax=Cohnella lubricantis TaxID=2163172 RepID=A0A841TEY1_9BACL|nr:LTA synthase family protein [Cohnella lubricantis]MBB6678635.1 LTA synthase family protein [Cohnella lubricantis]MBP2119205.1 phosphoglycerol transferase MdoB-like AlkP superfamily enzyme [Cohnella lubricantis]